MCSMNVYLTNCTHHISIAVEQHVITIAGQKNVGRNIKAFAIILCCPPYLHTFDQNRRRLRTIILSGKNCLLSRACCQRVHSNKKKINC